MLFFVNIPADNCYAGPKPECVESPFQRTIEAVERKAQVKGQVLQETATHDRVLVNVLEMRPAVGGQAKESERALIAGLWIGKELLVDMDEQALARDALE